MDVILNNNPVDKGCGDDEVDTSDATGEASCVGVDIVTNGSKVCVRSRFMPTKRFGCRTLFSTGAGITPVRLGGVCIGGGGRR